MERLLPADLGREGVGEHVHTGFERAEIPDKKRFIHNFRHTFATDLLQRGIPIEDVAALLGNSVKIVKKHYSHFVKARRDRLEERVRALWS